MRGTMRKKFICPTCGENIGAPVIDTDNNWFKYRRYRKCELCGTVFVTQETIMYTTNRKGREVNG